LHKSFWINHSLNSSTILKSIFGRVGLR